MRDLSRLGERRAIRLLTNLYGRHDLPLGYDDDVSALRLNRTSLMIAKSDMLVESTDVPKGMTDREAGRKSIVSVISDFASKGIRPLGLVVSLGLPRGTQMARLKMIGQGLADGSKEYDCPIIGGDTGESKELVINVSGFATARAEEIVRRDGARPGDIVAVTGPFGNASAGLHMLTRKNSEKNRSFRLLQRTVRSPRARLVEGIRLRKAGTLTASIDSSDGLAWSLNEIARLSKVRIKIENLPISTSAKVYADENHLSSDDLTLYGGEEYELVVTIRKGMFRTAERLVPSLLGIGMVEKGYGVYASLRGVSARIRPRGWEHFKS